ncbi:unnamed protein product [Discula destructiva]
MDEMLARRNVQVAGHIKAPTFAIGRRVAPTPEDAVKKTWNLFPSRVVGRATSSTDTADCHNTKASNTCEKPMGTSVATEITIGILVPLAVAFICVLIYFHRRNMKRQAMEDRDPNHKSLDFGLGEAGSNTKSKRRSKLGLGGEKSGKTRGLSIDMNLSSPYLLPEHVQGSRESMNSLARTLHQADDPYRPVAALLNETGSVRSYSKEGGRYTPSVMTNGTKRMSRQSYAHPSSPGGLPPQPLRQNSYPKSPLTPSASSSVTAVESDYSGPDAKDSIPEHGPMPPPQCDLPAIPTIPEIRQPAPVAQRDESTEAMQKFDFSITETETVDESNPRSNTTHSNGVGLGLQNGSQAPTQSSHVSEVTVNQDINAGPAHQSVSAVIEYDYAALITSTADDDHDDDEERGRGRVRESGLGLPAQNNNRLSVGARPLPPSDVLEHEDPETRANRIRSFYKEYFEDTKGAPPMPAIPGEYGDSTVDNYGDAAYFDPDSNQFVMPYAEPITRRAMTPPPTGRIPGGPGPRGPSNMGPRGPGPRGPPRNFAGSMGGSSMHGMPLPPRAGTSMSGYGPRPDSSASARGAPRAGSAMSARPKKPVAPPSPLNTLPTPGKLTDDHFSLINAADFAPPTNYSERVRGRSQSPLGERRNFAPAVPVASPLVGTLDEMAALPSPYALRKSGNFSGLDFAPPKRVRDPDSMSDAGSIRSNRSGLSRVNESAIRNGAGRVSRLPGDIIFSQAQMASALKPSFNMINNY